MYWEGARPHLCPPNLNLINPTGPSRLTRSPPHPHAGNDVGEQASYTYNQLRDLVCQARVAPLTPRPFTLVVPSRFPWELRPAPRALAPTAPALAPSPPPFISLRVRRCCPLCGPRRPRHRLPAPPMPRPFPVGTSPLTPNQIQSNLRADRQLPHLRRRRQGRPRRGVPPHGDRAPRRHARLRPHRRHPLRRLRRRVRRE